MLSTAWRISDRGHIEIWKAMFAAGIILFVEKLFLHFVAINFHEKALADRIAENQLGLKALDRLSNAQPVTPSRRPNNRRGHKSSRSLNALDSLPRSQKEEPRSAEIGVQEPSPTGSKLFTPKPSGHPRRRRKNVTSIIVDQVRH